MSTSSKYRVSCEVHPYAFYSFLLESDNDDFWESESDSGDESEIKSIDYDFWGLHVESASASHTEKATNDNDTAASGDEPAKDKIDNDTAHVGRAKKNATHKTKPACPRKEALVKRSISTKTRMQRTQKKNVANGAAA